MISRLFLVACGILIGLLTLGCNSPHGTVKVTGKLTVNGESPPAKGTITFTPVKPADGFPMRPAMAEFGPDGNYAARTFAPNDGLLPGSYQVAIECYETPPNMDGIPVKSHLHSKYGNGRTSGLELSVQPGARPVRYDIALEK